MTAYLKYALVDTPYDFAKFVVSGFSKNQLSQTKNLSENFGLVSSCINFAEIIGYTHNGFDKFKDFHKSFRILSGAFSFVPSMVEDFPNIFTVENVANYAKGVFGNFTSFCALLSDFNLPISSKHLKMAGGIGAVAGGVASTFSLASGIKSVINHVKLGAGRVRNLTLTADFWSLAQKITLFAISALTVMSTFVSLFVAVPAVPLVVMPALGFSAAMFGLFNKYVNVHVAAAKSGVVAA